MTRSASVAAAGRLTVGAGVQSDYAIVPVTASQGHVVDIRVSHADFDAQCSWLAGRLLEMGVGPGSLVVTVSHPLEVWSGSLPEAVYGLGGYTGSVDVFPYEAPRLALFLSRLRPTAVVGVTAAIAGGITDMNLYDGVTVVARPETRTALEAAGVRHGVIATLGPAVALSLPGEDELHYDPSQAELRVTDGILELRWLAAPLPEWLVTRVEGELTGPGRFRLTGG